MHPNEARSHIEEAHRAYDDLRSRDPKEVASPDLIELIHPLIHALDAVEKRVTRLDGPMFPRISERVNPIVKRQGTHIWGVLGRVWGAISRRMPHFRRDEPALAGTTLQIGHDVTELREEVRSLRQAMEAIVQKG
jgi:hypothetical protein